MSGDASRWVVLTVGGFQLLANAALLTRGVVRIPRELAEQSASARLADLLRTSWIYGALGNLCVSVALLLLAGGVRDGHALSRQLVTLVGAYYVALGPAAYLFGQRRHAGVLVFSLLGGALMAAVL